MKHLRNWQNWQKQAFNSIPKTYTTTILSTCSIINQWLMLHPSGINNLSTNISAIKNETNTKEYVQIVRLREPKSFSNARLENATTLSSLSERGESNESQRYTTEQHQIAQLQINAPLQSRHQSKHWHLRRTYHVCHRSPSMPACVITEFTWTKEKLKSHIAPKTTWPIRTFKQRSDNSDDCTTDNLHILSSLHYAVVKALLYNTSRIQPWSNAIQLNTTTETIELSHLVNTRDYLLLTIQYSLCRQLNTHPFSNSALILRYTADAKVGNQWMAENKQTEIVTIWKTNTSKLNNTSQ